MAVKVKMKRTANEKNNGKSQKILHMYLQLNFVYIYVIGVSDISGQNGVGDIFELNKTIQNITKKQKTYQNEKK